MAAKRKVHFQYTGSGYVDRGICQPWDYRSKDVTVNPDKVTCKLCKSFVPGPGRPVYTTQLHARSSAG